MQFYIFTDSCIIVAVLNYSQLKSTWRSAFYYINVHGLLFQGHVVTEYPVSLCLWWQRTGYQGQPQGCEEDLPADASAPSGHRAPYIYLLGGIHLLQRWLVVSAGHKAQACLSAVNEGRGAFREQFTSSVLNTISRQRVIPQRTISFPADHRRSLRGHPSTLCAFRSTKKPAGHAREVCW